MMASPNYSPPDSPDFSTAAVASTETFDHITALAASLSEAPMAMAARTARDEPEVLATVGFESQNFEPALSLCAHVARSEKRTVVEDATTDERFADHPLVPGTLGIRFCAGIPLTDLDGQPFGVLLVIDTHPRSPSEDTLQQLERLSAVGAENLTLRRTTETPDPPQESDDLRRRAQRIAQLGYWEHDLKTGDHTCSEEARRIFGWAEDEEMSYETFLEAVHSDDRERLRSAHEAAATGTKELDVEYRIHRPSGEERVLHERGALRRDEAGNPASLLGTVRDITDRKTAERAIQESEERFHPLFEEHSAPMLLIDPESGIIVDANASAVEFYGYDAETLTSMTVQDLNQLPPHEVAARRAKAQSRSQNRFVFPHQLKSGEVRTVEVHSTPLTVQDTPLLFSIIHDITEQKEAEQALQEERDRFATLFQNLPTPVVHVRPGPQEQLRVQTINEAFEETFGHTHAEIEGHALKECIVPENQQEEATGIRRRLLAGEPIDQEVQRETADGRRIFRMQGAIREGESGPTDGYAIYTDITTRKEREQELERTRDLLTLTEKIADVGGWSVEVSEGDLHNAAWTDTLYDIFEMYPEEPPPIEKALAFYHPEDRARHRKAIDRALDTGEGWDQEIRLTTAQGTKRWIRNIGEPVTEDGEVVKIRGTIQDITDQKQREQELRRSRERWRRLVDKLQDGLHIAVDGEIRYVNPAGAQILGANDPEDVVGRPLRQFIPPAEDQQALFEERFQKIQRGEATNPAEMEIIGLDGEHRTIESYTVPIEFEGAHAGQSFFRDVTERKAMEEALREREERLRSITENVSDGIYRSTPNEGLVYANQALADMLGYDDSDELLEIDPVHLYAHPESREVIRQNARETGSGAEEVKLRREDGSTFTGLLSATTVRDEEGNVKYYDGAVADITEQKKQARTLQDRQEKLESLYEATRHLLKADRPEAVAARIHDVLQTIFDYPIAGVNLVDEGHLVPEQVTVAEGYQMPKVQPRPLDGDSLGARAYRAGETVVAADTTTLNNNVEYGDLHSAACVPIGTHGVAFMGQGTDAGFDSFDLRLVEVLATYGAVVLDRLDREQELRTAKEEAEEASRLKSAMLANMSHEIRTPLTSITGFAEVLKDHLEGDLATFAEKAYTSSQRLMETLDSVLQLSKLEAGVHDLEREEVRLDTVVEETVEMLRSTAAEKPVTLQTRLPDAPVEGHWNEGALNRIVGNLLENAIKFTPPEGDIELRVRNEPDKAVLEVEDTGIGIDDAFRDQIFEAFNQESTGLRREYEGSGLGLSIVKRLVEAHGGDIEVESEKGVGTCFTVHLPRESRNAT